MVHRDENGQQLFRWEVRTEGGRLHFVWATNMLEAYRQVKAKGECRVISGIVPGRPMP